MKKLFPSKQEQAFMNVLLETRYSADEIIARGGMGTVFLGTDSVLNRKVAIKLLRTSLEDEALVRFGREAAIIASFSHPNLVELYTHGTYEGFTYLILEYVPGKSLSDILAQGRLSVQATVELGICIAAALAEAHAAKVIHRDLKPGNILVEQTGERVKAKLVDFGVAYQVSNGTRLTSAGAICGTPGYIAPEQIAGVDITTKCDLYSLGIVLFECLTGKRAFEGNNPVAVLIRQTQHGSPSLKNYTSLEIPAKLERLISELVCREPEDRPESAKVIYRVLKEIQHTLDYDSDTHRKTMPLKAITRKQIERSLSMPVREGGGWEQLLGAAPGISEHSAIDPQIFAPNPNLIDISFEFENEGVLKIDKDSLKTTEMSKPKLPLAFAPERESMPSPPKALSEKRALGDKAPVSKRDFSELELQVVQPSLVPAVKLPSERPSMKPLVQFVMITFITMTITLALVYAFTERDSLVDHIPTTKKIPDLPKIGPKPSPPKEWKRIQEM